MDVHGLDEVPCHRPKDSGVPELRRLDVEVLLGFLRLVQFGASGINGRLPDAPLMSAKLVGYGDAQGTEQFLGFVQGNLGFAPGKHGFRSDAAMPAGDYLLVVDADGPWVVTFSSAQ